MVSEDDAKDRDTDRPGSPFGPGVGDFGPPVGDFGPPVGDFGPPVDDFGGPPLTETGPMWKPPADAPEIGWRPADGSVPPATAAPQPAPGPLPAPGPQAAAAPPPADPTVKLSGPAADAFRAPDSAATTDAPADNSVEETVRYTGGSAALAGTAPAEPAKPAQSGPQRWWNSPTDSGDVPKPPADSGSPAGLSWADDPIAKRLAPKPAAATSSGGGSGSSPALSTRTMLIGIAVVVVLLIALVVTIVSLSGDDEDGRSGATTTAALSCPANRTGKVVVGNGQGSTQGGPEVILGFQYAFYVERDGDRVRQFVADDSTIPTAPIIQQAIDEEIPVGTTHCVRIAEVASDTFDVDLTEHRPDGTTTVYAQRVTTVNREGKILITTIENR